MRDLNSRFFRKLYRNKTARRILPNSVRDHLRGERKLIKACLLACRRYRLSHRPLSHRHIYGEIIYREDVWTGETILAGLSSIRLFDAASASGDVVGAQNVAQRILDGLGDALRRSTWRTILAARALLIHDSLAICDRLLLHLKDEDEDPADALIERVVLTLFQEEATELNRQIIRKLVVSGKAPQLVLLEWMRRCWLYEGASDAVLQDMLSYGERYKNAEALLLLREPLALALLLDDMSIVKKLLSDYPELEQSYACVLPLARYLASKAFSTTLADKRGEILGLAMLHTQLDEGSRSLLGLLRDHTRSIAIVGNSPCELGLGKGQRIDAHNVVARFNRFSIADEFARDYGQKCTIHVRHPRDVGINDISLASDIALMNRPDFVYRERKWTNILALNKAGATISALPLGFHPHLYRSLGGEPSGGIIFCALVKSMRGRLPRESCFGFSFVDQIGSSASSAHYFANARPSFKHRWKLEKKMFEEMTCLQQ